MDSHPSTYVEGEDDGRLAQAAVDLGLEEENARVPPANVRFLQSLLTDRTLETARMHSVGALGNDEHIDQYGNVHMTLTVTRRRRKQRRQPDYGDDLANLFQQGPLPDEDGEDEEDDESVEEEETIDLLEGGSMTAAVFGIIKATIGSAVLFLPRGFSIAGYAVAVPTMILATASYIYSANRLLQCWSVEKEKASKIDEIRALLLESPNHYGAVANDKQESYAGKLLTYPELAHRAFGDISVFVKAGIALMQFGVCLTYLIFVPQNLYEATKALFDVEIDKSVFLFGMVLVEIPISWIRDIRKLTPYNVLATFLTAYGLISCLVIAFCEIRKDPDSNYIQRLESLPPVKSGTWFLFVGTAFFAFEGCITLIVPLQEAVMRDEDKKQFPSANQKVTSSIVAFYIFFALTCWAAFGNSIKTALTASLPPGPFSTIAQMAYSIAVTFSFPLQAFPAMGVLFRSAGGRTSPSEVMKLNVISSLVICLLGLVAHVAIDYLGNVVSLLGSLVGIPIALIYPPLMHNILVRDVSTPTRWMNNLVAGIGVLAMGATSYTTIAEWDRGAE